VTTVGAPASETSLLRYSRWALYATVAGLPLYVVRWHYGPIPTTLLETLIVVTAGLYVIARWREGMRRPLKTQYDVPILLLLLAGAISMVIAADQRAALGLYRAYFIEPVAIFYVAVDLLRLPQTARRVVLALAIGSSLLSILNLVAVARALASHSLQVGSAPNALYGDANYVALYLDPVVALAAAFVLFGEGRLRQVGVVWLAVTGLALLLTFSKGAYLALGVLGLIAVLSLRRWRWPLLAGLVVMAAAIAQIPPIKDRWSTAENSLLGRLEIFQATVVMIKDHPILGIGLGGFHIRYRGFATEPYPHNIFLAFWVEVGLLGLIAFTVILLGLLWRGWRAWPHVDGIYRPALWGTLLGLLMWIVHGMVDTPYWKNDMSVEFWLLAAIDVVAIAGIARPGATTPRPEQVPTTISP